MDDPFEQHLRSLLQDDASPQSSPEDDKRLERVLHRAHIHGGLFDLLKLFANWGWVISEGGARGLRHARPVRRSTKDASSSDLNT
ncbi:MAG: hypothetical protein GX071_06175 [Gammaproteobacteria bacterium]|jgi:hypothetical protein|uniref:CrfX protein n=1 Tax=uncultured bacterium IN-10 TaxID=1805588 RepID=A0A142BW65_9BACT|nr:hypothetical protein [uncultured bacterium IN-10]NLY58097.1 hypothetical protein [Gammaproteobacteria bacterium]